MTNHLLRLTTASVFLLGLHSTTALAQSGPPGGIQVPPVPLALEVPEGHTVYLKGEAVGTQNYICMLNGSTVTWRFLGPQATVYQPLKNGVYQQIATHFLSANPSENGLPRATWQHSFDTSAVWAAARASSTDPAFVEPGAVAWLLLETRGTAFGPAGGWFLAQTTFIQRLNTSGGIAPSTGCSVPDDAGRMALVPYTTDYFFYRAD